MTDLTPIAIEFTQAVEGEGENEDKVYLYGPLYQGKFTIPTAGQADLTGGVTVAGLKRWKELLAEANAGRCETGLEVERAFLVKYKEEKGLIAENYEEHLRLKRRKNNKGEAVAPLDEVEEEEEEIPDDY